MTSEEFDGVKECNMWLMCQGKGTNTKQKLAMGGHIN